MSDVGYWRHGADAFFVASRYHVGGALGEAGAQLMQVVPDKLYATPLLLSRAVTIDGLLQRVNAVSSGVVSQMALYGVECWAIPVPTRIVSQGSQAPNFAGFTMRGYCSSLTNGLAVMSTSAASYQIGDRRLFWLAATWTGSAQVQAVHDDNRWAFFGYEATSLAVPIGFLVTSWPGSTTLPNTFPAVWTAAGSSMPALGVRITA
jgi:hypothetical protein